MILLNTWTEVKESLRDAKSIVGYYLGPLDSFPHWSSLLKNEYGRSELPAKVRAEMAGKGIELSPLFKESLEALEVRTGAEESDHQVDRALEILIGNVPDNLTQLVRDLDMAWNRNANAYANFAYLMGIAVGLRLAERKSARGASE